MKVEFKHIEKSFNKVHVLKDVNLVIDGQVQAIMGENGAGKSTLMKILTGVYQPTSGEIFIDGVQKHYKHPKEAEKDGIVFIHQELTILPEMSVTENIFLNKEYKKGFIVDSKKMNAEAKTLLESLGSNIDVTKRAGSYSVGQQQIIEIAKAIREDAKLLIMDEPTAALSEKECEKLFKIINDLKDKGITIVYISHRMEEVFLLSDKISVLRDGMFIATMPTKETSFNEVIKLMVGRELKDIFPKKPMYSEKVILKVDNISKKNHYHNISFELHEGEILGIAGLMGAGRTEIMHGIFGSQPVDSGSIYMNNHKLKNNIENSIKHKIAFITEDRKSEGIITSFDIKNNIPLTNLESISNNSIISLKKEKAISDEFMEKLHIKASGINHKLEKMSGGNQQKVVISKWLNIHPKVLIMDEPTRGVDIGAKKEIYDIMTDLCEQKNNAIILVSSELGEVIGMSDRILVLREGEMMGILDKKDATQENIMTLATGGSI
ncbi:sugar ABC transporter ATP-binding protein [Mycoplasma sp. P36-A1]|uniref:sugar ABC transporter ATP-binding protein n=1 Tax=Mycoplasma sp. P36-A1 TaxID=3252900 RepID=UPI003C304C18